MAALGMLVPVLFFLVWLGFVIYLLQLATRLVLAVEQIARRMS